MTLVILVEIAAAIVVASSVVAVRGFTRSMHTGTPRGQWRWLVPTMATSVAATVIASFLIVGVPQPSVADAGAIATDADILVSASSSSAATTGDNTVDYLMTIAGPSQVLGDTGPDGGRPRIFVGTIRPLMPEGAAGHLEIRHLILQASPSRHESIIGGVPANDHNIGLPPTGYVPAKIVISDCVLDERIKVDDRYVYIGPDVTRSRDPASFVAPSDAASPSSDAGIDGADANTPRTAYTQDEYEEELASDLRKCEPVAMLRYESSVPFKIYGNTILRRAIIDVMQAPTFNGWAWISAANGDAGVRLYDWARMKSDRTAAAWDAQRGQVHGVPPDGIDELEAARNRLVRMCAACVNIFFDHALLTVDHNGSNLIVERVPGR